jgi:hypothetical protein
MRTSHHDPSRDTLRLLATRPGAQEMSSLPQSAACLCTPCPQLAVDGEGPICIRCFEAGCNPPLVFCGQNG